MLELGERRRRILQRIVPSPAKRFGSCATKAATPSFTMRETFAACSFGAS